MPSFQDLLRDKQTGVLVSSATWEEFQQAVAQFYYPTCDINLDIDDTSKPYPKENS